MSLNLVNMLYEQIRADDAEREHPRKPHHYPSSACSMIEGKFAGSCRRATWFSWKGFKRDSPPDASAIFKMNTGDLIHDMLNQKLVRAMERQGISQVGAPGTEVEFHWTPPGLQYEVSGRMDHVLLGPDGRTIKVEWKSTYGRGADYIKRDGPKVENLLQSRLYLDQPVIPTDEIFLIYAARDSGYMFGYLVEKEDRGLLVHYLGSNKTQVVPITLEGYVGATAMLEEYLNGDDAPPKDYGGSDWQCKYCSYQNTCLGAL